MLSRIALTTRQPLLRQAFPLSTASGTVDGKLTLKITRSDQVPAARWQELDAIEAGFQEQLLKTDFKGLRHCTATGYWPRLKYAKRILFLYSCRSRVSDIFYFVSLLFKTIPRWDAIMAL